MRDIFRKYPNKYENLLDDFLKEIKTIDEPKAKASLIWILGQYVEEIENGDEIIKKFYLKSFNEESSVV